MFYFFCCCVFVLVEQPGASRKAGQQDSELTNTLGKNNDKIDKIRVVKQKQTWIEKKQTGKTKTPNQA